jgi:hypothetical protein
MVHPVMRNTKDRPCKVRNGPFVAMMLLLTINIMLAACENSPCLALMSELDESLLAKFNSPVQPSKEKEWHNKMLSIIEAAEEAKAAAGAKAAEEAKAAGEAKAAAEAKASEEAKAAAEAKVWESSCLQNRLMIAEQTEF